MISTIQETERFVLDRSQQQPIRTGKRKNIHLFNQKNLIMKTKIIRAIIAIAVIIKICSVL